MKRFQPSAETETKERHFRGLLGGIHVPVCKRIREKYGRPGDPPYLYIDLHGGPGNLEYQGRRFDGSPLIAHEVLTAAGIPYRAAHFEHDPEVAAELTEAVAGCGDVFAEPFEEGIRRRLGDQPAQPYRHGLVYSDPIEDPIPVDTFNLLADKLPRVDLLAYVAANSQYKRANANGHGHGRRLEDDIRAVSKKVVLIREPHGPHQWTFILWTNWTDLKDWKAQGFHRLDTAPGRRWLDRMNFTARELHQLTNDELPLDDPPYRTYREYLKHPRFLATRAVVFDRAGGRCVRCGERPPTEPHHLRYPPWGEFDVPENMIALCHPCHCDIHGKAS